MQQVRRTDEALQTLPQAADSHTRRENCRFHRQKRVLLVFQKGKPLHQQLLPRTTRTKQQAKREVDERGERVREQRPRRDVPRRIANVSTPVRSGHDPRTSWEKKL